MNNTNRNLIITGAVALVAGLIIGWFIGHGSAPKTAMTGGNNMVADSNSAMNENKNTDDSSMAGEDSSMSSDTDAAVMVSDQTAGDAVTVASVETSKPTWVAVREDNNGVMGNILGASRVDAGASNNIVVNLLRPTMAGKDYFVVLFTDNGDRTFDYKTDMPVDSNGSPFSQTFKAQ